MLVLTFARDGLATHFSYMRSVLRHGLAQKALIALKVFKRSFKRAVASLFLRTKV